MSKRRFKGVQRLNTGAKTTILYLWLKKRTKNGIWIGSMLTASIALEWGYGATEGAFRRLRERGLIESGLGAGYSGDDEPFWEVK